MVSAAVMIVSGPSLESAASRVPPHRYVCTKFLYRSRLPPMLRASDAIWSMVSRSRSLCRPENSVT